MKKHQCNPLGPFPFPIYWLKVADKNTLEGSQENPNGCVDPRQTVLWGRNKLVLRKETEFFGWFVKQ